MPADSPLPETSLAEAADTVEVIERAESFVASGHSVFGPGFSELRSQRAFQTIEKTTELRQYRLSQVHLDTACMVLIKNGRKIRETNYLMWPKDYENAKVLNDDMIRLDERSEYLLGCNRGPGNYFHWMTQCLPAIDSSLRHSRSDNPTLALRQLGGWQEESLQLLGYSNTPRVTLDPSHHYQFPNLTYSDFLYGRTAFGISRAAAETYGRLRKAVVDEAAPSGRDLIYIARSDSAQRRMTNEAEVITRLEKLGVQIVVPGYWPIAEQISIFNRAAIVIGAHGAGLTNVVFCRPGTIFYEMHPSFYLNPCFWWLAQVAGLEYHANIFGNDAAHASWVHDMKWSVDIGILESRLSRLRVNIQPRLIAIANSPAKDAAVNTINTGGSIPTTAATDNVTIESMVEFRPAAPIALGDRLLKSPAAAMFGPQTRTATIHMRTIENVVFDGGAMALAKEGHLDEGAGSSLSDSGGNPGDIIDVSDSERVVIACNPPWKNYFHWMTQCLPAIDWAVGTGGARGLRIATPNLDAWHEEVLSLLAYDKLPRLQVDGNCRYRLRKAVYGDFFLGKTSFAVSGAVLATLRRVGNAVPARQTGHELVYVKAHNQFYGKLENEGELIAAMEKMGFHIADITNSKVADQINLFRSAKLVVTPHGFAMTNVAFCQPAAVVWELFPAHYTNACYNRLAQAAGVEYWADLFESRGNASPQDWRVDLNVMNDRIRYFNLRERPPFLLAQHRYGVESNHERRWTDTKPLDNLLRGFESLGEDCEFGLVQREVGIEQLGLLRFASFYFPLEQRLSKLVAAVERSFEGLGEPGRVQVRLEGEPGRRREFLAYESGYDILYHTGVHEGDDEPERLKGQQEKVLQFLRRKMLDDLGAGEKTWVWKTRLELPTHGVMLLHDALRRYGPNRLLWVSHETEAHPAGDIEVVRDGLWHGYVEACSTATKFVAGPWYEVCRKVDRLRQMDRT
jgi:capsular polysaccharide biosynthesis protein